MRFQASVPTRRTPEAGAIVPDTAPRGEAFDLLWAEEILVDAGGLQQFSTSMSQQWDCELFL
jgi:hypothetical protein